MSSLWLSQVSEMSAAKGHFIRVVLGELACVAFILPQQIEHRSVYFFYLFYDTMLIKKLIAAT